MKEGEEADYKGDSKFASHLKSSSGVSAFAKSRTLKEQREYLPVYNISEGFVTHNEVSGQASSSVTFADHHSDLVDECEFREIWQVNVLIAVA